MTTLLENPMPILLFGIFVEAVLAIALLKSGRAVLLWAMVGVLVLVLLGVGLEWLVVTEVEEVEAVLDATAAALRANSQDAVLACCAESARRTRSEARRALAWVEFTKVKLSRLDIKIIRQTSPPMATARFNAVVAGRDRKDSMGHYRSGPIGFTVKLRRTPDGWRITEHALENAPGGF